MMAGRSIIRRTLTVRAVSLLTCTEMVVFKLLCARASTTVQDTTQLHDYILHVVLFCSAELISQPPLPAQITQRSKPRSRIKRIMRMDVNEKYNYSYKHSLYILNHFNDQRAQ